MKLRERIVMALGGRCANCGFNEDIRVLHIDHVLNNGKRERADYKSRIYEHIYSNMYNGDYQVLCANCNLRKQLDHATGRIFIKPKTMKALEPWLRQITDAKVLFMWETDQRTVIDPIYNIKVGKTAFCWSDDTEPKNFLFLDDGSVVMVVRSPKLLAGSLEEFSQVTAFPVEFFRERFNVGMALREYARVHNLTSEGVFLSISKGRKSADVTILPKSLTSLELSSAPQCHTLPTETPCVLS